MGEIGGFYEAIFIIIGLITNSISSRLFKGNIASAFYLVKKSDENDLKGTDKVDIENKKSRYGEGFDRIQINQF